MSTRPNPQPAPTEGAGTPTQYTTLDTLAPHDVIRTSADDDAWLRVLAIARYDVEYRGTLHDRVSIVTVPLAYEGWPGGHIGVMADADYLVERACDLIPTVMHPLHATA